jgi:hypothetical protein
MTTQMSSPHPDSPFAAVDAGGEAPDATPGSVRLIDVMARVEPTWVEAVAVVQAVCAQLAPNQAPPMAGDIILSNDGAVSFAASGMSDDEAAIKAVGRLLTSILRQGDCPMPVWEATELARRSPQTFGTPQRFGQSLTCFPAHQGPQELAAYVTSSRRQVLNPARPATAVFGMSLTARALLIVLAVSAGGVGTGMSVGALVARRTVAPRVAVPGMVARASSAALR